MLFFQLLALAGLLAGLYGIYLRYAETKRRTVPADNSPIKGNLTDGIQVRFHHRYDAMGERVHTHSYDRVLYAGSDSISGSSLRSVP